MVDANLFLLFMAGALALNLTPGPDMTFVLAQAAHRGTRAGIAAALGVGTGGLLWALLTAMGLAAVLRAAPVAFTVVKIGGAAYLVWIAVAMIRKPPRLGAMTDHDAAQTVRAAYRQGFVTNILNPKVAVFFIAFLPQFVARDAGPAWLQILLLGVAFDMSGTIVNAIVAFGGGSLSDRLRRNPAIGKVLGWLSAGVMLGLAARILCLERR